MPSAYSRALRARSRTRVSRRRRRAAREDPHLRLARLRDPRLLGRFASSTTLDAEQALLQMRVGAELRRRHRARDAAVHHHVDRVGDLDRDADVLLDQSTAISPLDASAFSIRRPADDHRREALGRLVHDEQARVEQQRPRDSEHLLLAAGKLGTAVLLALGEARERLVDALDGPRVRLCSRAAQPQVLVHRQRRPDAPPLRHVADALACDPFGGRPRISSPASRTLPARRTRPVIALHSVVLPMPLRPTTASTPRSSVSETSCKRVRAAVVDVSFSIGEDRSSRPCIRRARAAHVDLLHFGIVLDLCGVPSLSMRPLCITVTRSTTRNAISRSCSIRTEAHVREDAARAPPARAARRATGPRRLVE
jgi:hypothetical protein